MLSFLSFSASNHYMSTTMNAMSSDPQRLRVVNFSIDQNAFMNVCYELMQPWDNILVKKIVKNFLPID